MKIELKLCPFCGGEAEVVDINAYTGRGAGLNSPREVVRCKSCGAVVEHHSGLQSVLAWNARDEHTCYNLADGEEARRRRREAAS